MEKTYYIFLALVSVVSLAVGSLTTYFLYCEREIVEKETEIQSGKKTEKVSKVKTEPGCDFFVDVSGAVLNPGVFCLSEGSIVNDAIQKAGNFNPQAYAFKYIAQRVNLARELTPEEKIYIPFLNDVVCNFVVDENVKKTSEVVKEIDKSQAIEKVVTKDEEEEKKDVVTKEEKEKSSDCININTDSKEKLMELTGVGETRAQDIIEGRPYSDIEDIKNVKGIGDATFEKIKDSICI